MKGRPGSSSFSRVQSNGLPSPPGRVASFGARASNSSQSATPRIGRDGRRGRRGLDRQRLHHRQPETRASAPRPAPASPCREAAACRASAPRRCAAKVASSASTVSATLLARPFTRAPRSRARAQVDMPRRRRKEHEADKIGAGIERGVERSAVLQAADFDERLVMAGRVLRAPARLLSALRPPASSTPAWPPPGPRSRCRPT